MKYLYVLLVAVLPQCLMAEDDLIKTVKKNTLPVMKTSLPGWNTYLFKTKNMGENDLVWSDCDPRFSGVPSKAFGKYLYALGSLKPTQKNLKGKSAGEAAFVKYVYGRKPMMYCCGVAVNGTDTLAFPVFVVPTAGKLDGPARREPFYLLVKGRGAKRRVKVVRKQDANDAVAALGPIVTRGMKDAFIRKAIWTETRRMSGKSLKLTNSELLMGYRKKALVEYRAKLDEEITEYKAKPENKFGPKWILTAKANIQFVKDGFVPDKFIKFYPKKSLKTLLYVSAFPKVRHYLPPSRYELELGKDLGRKTPIATLRSWENAYYSDNPKRVEEFRELGPGESKHSNKIWKRLRKSHGLDGMTRMMVFSEFYTTIDKTEYCLLPIRMSSPGPKPVYFMELVVVKKVGGEWLETTDLDWSLYRTCWFDSNERCRTQAEYDALLALCKKHFLHFGKLYPTYSSRWEDWRFTLDRENAEEGDEK